MQYFPFAQRWYGELEGLCTFTEIKQDIKLEKWTWILDKDSSNIHAYRPRREMFKELRTVMSYKQYTRPAYMLRFHEIMSY